MGHNWQTGETITAALLNGVAQVADISTPGTATGDALKTAYAAVLTATSGDQTARINATLAATPPFGTRRRVRLVGDFSISGPIIVPSQTTLTATDATITLTGGASVHMLENAAVQAARTITDLATTASSTTVTSATAAFTAGDVGKPVLVYLGDASTPRHLSTTVASVTNATTAVLATAVPVARTATGASIGTRDADITIEGGRWIRGTNGIPPGDNGLHSLFLRRVDRLTIRGLRFGSGSGKYGIHLADTRGFEVSDYTLDMAPSDGVHLGGLCFRGALRRISGVTGDDLAAITCVDYSIYNDVPGDVSDILFEDCTLTDLTNGTATPNAVAVYSDSTAGGYVARRITVRRCRDLATPAQRSVTITGNVQGLLVENCSGQVTLRSDAGTSSGALGTPTLDRVEIRAHEFIFRPGTNQSENAAIIQSANVPNLLIDGLGFANLPAGGINAWGVVVAPGTTIGKATIRRASRASNRGGIFYAYGSGTTVDVLTLEDCASDGLDYSGGSTLVSNDTGAVINTLNLRGVNVSRHSWGVNLAPRAGGSGGTLLTVTGCDLSDAINEIRVSGSGQLQVASAGTRWGGGNASLNDTAQIRSLGVGLGIDVSRLGAKSTGDMATNTSNSNTGTLGVGPVVYTGSAWKSLVSGNTF